MIIEGTQCGEWDFFPQYLNLFFPMYLANYHFFPKQVLFLPKKYYIGYQCKHIFYRIQQILTTETSHDLIYNFSSLQAVTDSLQPRQPTLTLSHNTVTDTSVCTHSRQYLVQTVSSNTLSIYHSTLMSQIVPIQYQIGDIGTIQYFGTMVVPHSLH